MPRRPIGSERLATVSIALPLSRVAELERYAQARGITQSHAGRLIVEEGLRVVRGQDPEKAPELLKAFQAGLVKTLPADLEEVYRDSLAKLAVKQTGVAERRRQKIMGGLRDGNPLAAAKAEAEAKADAMEAAGAFERRPLTAEEQAAVDAEIAALERERQEGEGLGGEA